MVVKSQTRNTSAKSQYQSKTCIACKRTLPLKRFKLLKLRDSGIPEVWSEDCRLCRARKRGILRTINLDEPPKPYVPKIQGPSSRNHRTFVETYGVLPDDFDPFFIEYHTAATNNEAAKVSKKSCSQLGRARGLIENVWKSESAQPVFKWIDKQIEVNRNLSRNKAFMILVKDLAYVLRSLNRKKRNRVDWYDLVWLVNWWKKQLGFDVWPRGINSSIALKQWPKRSKNKLPSPDATAFVSRHSSPHMIVHASRGTKSSKRK